MKLSREEVDDETWAMSTVIENSGGKNKLKDGRPAASKTGTWQLCDTNCKAADKNKNRDAWYAGFTPDLATVVHIGSSDKVDRSVGYYQGASKKESPMFGINLPGDLWKKFMDTVEAGKKKLPLPQAKHVGDPGKGDAQSPQPTQPPPDNGNGQQPCVPPNCVPPNGQGNPTPGRSG
jgi:membrane peptidoglycan carboxypeptidase